MNKPESELSAEQRCPKIQPVTCRCGVLIFVRGDGSIVPHWSMPQENGEQDKCSMNEQQWCDCHLHSNQVCDICQGLSKLPPAATPDPEKFHDCGDEMCKRCGKCKGCEGCECVPEPASEASPITERDFVAGIASLSLDMDYSDSEALAAITKRCYDRIDSLSKAVAPSEASVEGFDAWFEHVWWSGPKSLALQAYQRGVADGRRQALDESAAMSKPKKEKV